MGIAGAYRLGPESGRLLVHTTRTGLGAKAGHDLTLEVTRWHGRATVDPATPANSSVTVEVDADSFEVRKGTGGVKPLSNADRAEIYKTLKAILRTGQHPTITFRSRQVDGFAASFACDGELTIMGVTQPVMVQGRVADGRVVGEASVVQSRWGIRPYSAFFGALKLSDEVNVDVDVALRRTVDEAIRRHASRAQLTLHSSSEPFIGACDLDASSAAARRRLPSPPVSLSLRLCPAEDGQAALEVHHWTGERASDAGHCLHACGH